MQQLCGAKASKNKLRSSLLVALCTVAVLRLTAPPSFVGHSRYVSMRLNRQAIHPCALNAVVAQVKVPPAEGEREIVDGFNGPIVVANIGGKFYAVDAKCPHLGLPMKQGKIDDGPNGPEITCNFHNSKFDMKTGMCTKWVTGALGFENDLIAGVMGNVGGKKNDVTSYDIVTADDGSLSIVERSPEA